MSEWWQTFFDEYFLAYSFPRIKRSRTMRDVRFIETVLAPRKGAKILDVCCGIGRHALELAKRGYRITGVDITQQYLDVAAARARRRKVKIALERRDMRKLGYRGEFDAAILMWTSFGYFENEKDNMKSLRVIHRALRPGGKFLIDLINRDWLIRNFQPHGWMEAGKEYVLERRQFDPSTSRMHSEWVCIGEGEVARRETNLRVYSLHELLEMLERAGFGITAAFGDQENVMPTPEHRMLSILAHK